MTSLVSAKRVVEGIRIVHIAAAAASEGKAEGLVALDVRDISTVTDYFVIMTGSSQNHLKALGKRIEEVLIEAGTKASHVEGFGTTGWQVLDYGDVIIHAMLAEPRRMYDLERLWGDAPQVDLGDL